MCMCCRFVQVSQYADLCKQVAEKFEDNTIYNIMGELLHYIGSNEQKKEAVKCFSKYINCIKAEPGITSDFRKHYSTTYNIVQGVILQNHNETHAADSWLTCLTRHFLIYAIAQLNVGKYEDQSNDEKSANTIAMSEGKASEEERDTTNTPIKAKDAATNESKSTNSEGENCTTKMTTKYAYNFNRSSDAQLLLSALMVLLNKKDWNFRDVHNLLLASFEVFRNKTTTFMELLTLLQYNFVTPKTEITIRNRNKTNKNKYITCEGNVTIQNTQISTRRKLLTSDGDVESQSTGIITKTQTQTVREVLVCREKSWLYAISHLLRPVAAQIEFYNNQADLARRFARATMAELICNMKFDMFYMANLNEAGRANDDIEIMIARKEPVYKTAIRHTWSSWVHTIKKLANKPQSAVPALKSRLEKKFNNAFKKMQAKLPAKMTENNLNQTLASLLKVVSLSVSAGEL
jgi:hypothetical protein